MIACKVGVQGECIICMAEKSEQPGEATLSTETRACFGHREKVIVFKETSDQRTLSYQPTNFAEK